MYIDLDKREPVSLQNLNIQTLIPLQKDKNGPLVKIPFSLDIPYLKQDFNLDLIIWNLNEDNVAQTERVVRYVFKNFNKLFETGWTALYCYLQYDHEVAEHTVQEFFTEQVDFENPYYAIQLEINCNHLVDGQARYCFVVATTCDYRKWTITDDDVRVYMIGNKACGFNDNNEDLQMWGSLEDCAMFYEMGQTVYESMVQDGFQFAPPFKEE